MTLVAQALPFVSPARWTFLRLRIYAVAAVVTTSIFFAGAAFYSFVWPAPPVSTSSPKQSLELRPVEAPPTTIAPSAPTSPSLPPSDSTPVATRPAPNESIAEKPREPSMNRVTSGEDMMKEDSSGQISNATTGEAGPGAKPSSEQLNVIIKTIKKLIRQQHVQPVTNVNFSISVGAHVPRTIGFHPLPAEILTTFSDWRGYQFFLVSNQIVVVNPRTLEIVAVIFD